MPRDSVNDLSSDQNQTNPVPQENGKNTYGVLNHFRFLSVDKEIAERFGLGIEYRGRKDGFDVHSVHGKEALERLVAPFVSLEQGKDAVSLDSKTLKKFLRFLRQPIAESMTDASRRTGHHVSRFVSTGFVDIPLYIDEKLADAASLECHLKGERKMKEIDVWDNDPEFWHPEESIKTVATIPGSFYDPARGFVLQLDPRVSGRAAFEGAHQQVLNDIFWGALNTATNGRYPLRGASEVYMDAQEIKAFYALLPEVKGIDAVIRGAKIEEMAQGKLREIRAQADDLRADVRFQSALVSRQYALSPAQKMDNLKYAASALTPFVTSKTNYDVWRHSHYMEESMQLSNPVEHISGEYAALGLVLETLQQNGEAGAAELQAVINTFRPLCAFSEDLALYLADASTKKGISKRLDPEDLEIFRGKMDEIRTAFTQSSVNGISTTDPEGDYDEILKSVGNLMGVNGSLVRQAGVGYYDMMKGFWTGVGESAFDSPAFFALVVGLVGYAYYAKYGVDQQLMQQTIDNGMTVIAGGGSWGEGLSLPNLPEAGTGDISIPTQDYEELRRAGQEFLADALQDRTLDDCTLSVNCHYNYLLPRPLLDAIGEGADQYLKFRHYVGVDIIASNAETVTSMLPAAMEGVHNVLGLPVQYSLAFRDTAADVTYQGGLIFVDANMFQDASHASMFGYGMSRAAKNGFGAFKQMGGLSAEFLNPLRRFIVPVTDPLAKIAGPSLGYVFDKASFTGLGGWMQRRADNAHSRSGLKRKTIETAMSAVGGVAGSVVLEPQEPKQAPALDMDAAPVTLNIGWYGIGRKKIEITGGNILALEDAINELALTLEYSSDDIGIESPAYVEFLKERIQNVENALKGYRNGKGGDHTAYKNLQKVLNGDLQHVMGAELKFAGTGSIYELLFPDAVEATQELRVQPFYKRALRKAFGEEPLVLDDRRRHVLARHASKKEGRLMRQEFRAEAWEQFKTEKNPYADAGEGVFPAMKKAFGMAAQGYNKTRRLLAWGACALWGGVVFTAREGIQEPFNQIPAKGRLAAGASALALGSLSAEMAGVELGVVKAFSSAGAAVVGSASTLVIGGGMNIPQDLSLHTAAIGVSAAFAAAVYYYPVQRVIKPTFAALRETIGRQTGQRQKGEHQNETIYRDHE